MHFWGSPSPTLLLNLLLLLVLLKEAFFLKKSIGNCIPQQDKKKKFERERERVNTFQPSTLKQRDASCKHLHKEILKELFQFVTTAPLVLIS